MSVKQAHSNEDGPDYTGRRGSYVSRGQRLAQGCQATQETVSLVQEHETLNVTSLFIRKNLAAFAL